MQACVCVGHCCRLPTTPRSPHSPLPHPRQVHSGGVLRGTPHCVVAPRPGRSAPGVSRNTFAVFMQPAWDCPMEPPAGARPQDVGVGQWAPGLSFGAFSERTVSEYYQQG